MGSESKSSRTGAVFAPVIEVFASFQGEGLYVGQPQVFLRLAGCPLRCRWCDTPGSWDVRSSGSARIERTVDLTGGAGREVAREERVASPFRAALWIASVEPGEPRTVSVTGGEPLVWPEFIRALRPMIAPRRLHLETAGAHPEALARVLDVVDHVSLDLKLPSDMLPPVELGVEGGLAPTSERSPTNNDEWTMARRRCLDLIRDHDACAKVVVAAGAAVRDYDDLFEDVARRAPECPVFITPATPVGDALAPELDHLIDVVEHARDLDLDVRVIPQVHRALGIA